MGSHGVPWGTWETAGQLLKDDQTIQILRYFKYMILNHGNIQLYPMILPHFTSCFVLGKACKPAFV